MTDPDPATTAAPDNETWHLALQAGMQAQRDFRANRDNPEWDSDWDDEAEAIVEAAWPHIATYERAEARADERRRIREGTEAELTRLAGRHESPEAFEALFHAIYHLLGDDDD